MSTNERTVVRCAQVFSFRRSNVDCCCLEQARDFAVCHGLVGGGRLGTAVTYSPGKQFSPHDLKINGLKFVVTAVWDGASLSITVVGGVTGGWAGKEASSIKDAQRRRKVFHPKELFTVRL